MCMYICIWQLSRVSGHGNGSYFIFINYSLLILYPSCNPLPHPFFYIYNFYFRNSSS